jgi:hypothetical protein
MPDRSHDEGIRPGRPPDRDGGAPSGEPCFEVAFTLRVEDVLAFQDYHAAKQGRSSLWWAIPVAFLLISFLSLLNILSKPGQVDGRAITMLAVAVLVLGGYIFRHPLQRALVRRSLRRDPNFFKTHRVVLTPEAVEQSVGPSMSRTLWEGVRKVAVTETHLFLYLSPTQAIVIPGRVFATEEDFDDFIDAARDYHRTARRRRDEE